VVEASHGACCKTWSIKILHDTLCMQEVVTISVPAPTEPYRTLAVVGILARLTGEGITEMQTNKHSLSSGLQASVPKCSNLTPKLAFTHDYMHLMTFFLQDPLFKGRWEGVGRSVKMSETPLLAMRRQLQVSTYSDFFLNMSRHVVTERKHADPFRSNTASLMMKSDRYEWAACR
jgi:hypothetical protein